ncbi:MAG: TetR/AcrR family transcriptional regulator [Thermoleophilaceae bacterium]|nr:TetR/AcrR family transcriptional regulator [Thermoleophilaceae bacterium]
MPRSTQTENPGRDYGGESAGERDARRRRQLLDAGVHLFGTVGFRATTVRSLCAEAHVAFRNFYDYFDSLEDVLIAVYKECNARLMGAVIEAVGPIKEGMEIDDAAARGLEAFFSTVEDRELARVVWFEVLGVSDEVDQVYHENLKVFAKYLESLIEAWRPNASTPERRELLAITAVGGLSNLAMVWAMDGYDHARSEVVATGQQLIVSVASGL